MSIQVARRRQVQRKPFNEVIDAFKGGVNTLLDQTRLGKDQAVQATNLIQTQDGLWTTRFGSKQYGQVLPNGNTPDGFYEYVKSDESTELICVAGTVYKSTDGGSWSTITGATFTTGNKCYFAQIGSKLYITNGVDTLAYYDGSTLSTYSALSAPTGVTATRSGLSAGSYSYYVQITALNDVGETVGSTEASVASGINRPRDLWVTNDKVDIAWSSVVGATRYQVYISDESGYEALLGSTQTNAFSDDGASTVNPYVVVPLSNTTSAPKFKQMELSGNRLWATQDPNNRYRVYFSGTGQNLGVFSDFYGGGWIDIEKGGRNLPRAVVHYRTGKGDSIITVLCASPEGKGSIWQVDLTSATVGDVTFTVPSALKIIGSLGTDAPLSVVPASNNIFFYNKKGFTTLGAKPNLLNILTSDEISVPIRPSVRSLVGSKASGVAGYHYDGKIFWSVPESDTGNTKIMIFDVERGNWNPNAFNFGVSRFGEYTDTAGFTHFLAAPTSGDYLIELTPNVSGDLGEAFQQSYVSGLYPISKDRTVWARVKYAYVELNNPRGTITFTLAGTEKKSGFSTLGSVTISSLVSTTGFSYDMFSNNKLSSSSGNPTTFSSSSRRRRIRINKILNNYQFQVSSSGLDDSWTLSSLQVKGKYVPTRDPSSWLN